METESLHYLKKLIKMKIKSKKASKKLNALSKDLVKASYLREKEVQNSPVKNLRQDYNKMLDSIIKKEGSFFCSQPFIHLYVPTYGFAHPCCNTTVNVKKHVSQTGLNGIWNQPEFANLRKEMVNGNKERDATLKTCYKCIEVEYNEFESCRKHYNNDLAQDKEYKEELDRLVKFVIENPEEEYPIPNKVHTIELKLFGNYCNLKCLMCSAEDSSSVAEEWIALGEYTPEQILQRSEVRSGSQIPYSFPLINYQDNDIDEDEFWDMIRKSKRIKLLGGETWLIKQYVQILERCVKEGWAKDKKLFIFSNNYGYPNMQYIYDLLKEFEKVTYKCSLELWGDRNDYIRYPSKWPEIHKNIKLISMLPNVRLGLTLTVGPLNIGYVDDFVRGAQEIENKVLTFNTITRPAWYTLKSLPLDLKEFYLDKLYSNSYDILEQIEKPLQFLEDSEHNEMQQHIMISKIKARDKLRGDNILKYFPEWKPYFN